MPKSSQRRTLSRALLLTAAVFIMMAGYYLGNQYATRQPFDPGSITLLPEPKPLPEFSLVDHSDEALTRESLEGRWTLIYIGYTYCPDICPTTLTRYAQVMNRLQGQPEVLKKTRVLFVSVDPARDTPERIREYVQFFNPDFVGATGNPDDLANLAKELALFYQIQPPDENGNYAVDHSAAVAIVDPQARLAGYINAVMDPQVIATDLARLVTHFSGL